MKVIAFNTKVANFVGVILFILAGLSQSLYGQNLPDIQKECDNITPQKRQLAKSAGYDVDQLCANFTNNQPRATTKIERAEITPRKTETQQALESAPLTMDHADKNSSPHHRKSEATTALKLFGHDLFAGHPKTFAPGNNIPIPTNYLLGPGDTLEVLLYGKTNEFYSLQINRNGLIEFPSLGPINVTGLNFTEAKELLLNRISKEMIGVEVNVSLGELRSIQVFLLGEAYRPGSYTISSLSTITNALVLSGGVSSIASLRNIQLKRQGKTISSLDLYDLLLEGDISNDKRLQEGDVIFIPPVDKVIGISGAVRRPALYELRSERNIGQAVKLAGGYTNQAYLPSTRVTRNDKSGFKTVININLDKHSDRQHQINNGDLIEVGSIIEQNESVVTLSGHVHRPGDFLWRDDLRVSDIFAHVNVAKPAVDVNFGLIKRSHMPLGIIEPIYVNLKEALSQKNSDYDVVLQPRDELVIFSSSDENRADSLSPTIKYLKDQATKNLPARVVTVEGAVRFPGEYPLTKNMSLSQLIAAAGGLKDSAFLVEGEITRYDLSSPLQSKIKHFKFALGALGQKDNSILQPYDVVTIHRLPNFKDRQTIILEGEVKLPGSYTFKSGETLRNIIIRAGGLTQFAHAKAAVFSRRDLLQKEQQTIEALRERFKADAASAEIKSANEGKSTRIESQTILDAFSQVEAKGRLVIDLAGIIEGSTDDIPLKDGDSLTIPKYQQEISIVGEVQYPSTHSFIPSSSLKNYLKLSGGTTKRADRKRIYVVKANGSVKIPPKNIFGIPKTNQLKIEPGDAIVVPINVNKRSTFNIFSEVTSLFLVLIGAIAVL